MMVGWTGAPTSHAREAPSQASGKLGSWDAGGGAVEHGQRHHDDSDRQSSRQQQTATSQLRVGRGAAQVLGGEMGVLWARDWASGGSLLRPTACTAAGQDRAHQRRLTTISEDPPNTLLLSCRLFLSAAAQCPPLPPCARRPPLVSSYCSRARSRERVLFRALLESRRPPLHATASPWPKRSSPANAYTPGLSRRA